MVEVFVIVTLLYGAPKRTLDDNVFADRATCMLYLQHVYNEFTIATFQLSCAEKSRVQP